MSNLTNSHNNPTTSKPATSKPQRLLAFLLAFLFVLTSMLTIFPTHAYALSPGDPGYVGEGEDGVVGEDTEQGSKWDGSSGAWRIYIADNDGGIRKNPVDVTNLPDPVSIAAYVTPKLNSRNSSSLSALDKYEGMWGASIPSIQAGQDEIVAFWESANFEKFRDLCGDMGSDWDADEIIGKVSAGEWFIVIEPVFWFTLRNTYYAMTPTEMAVMDSYAPGYMTYVKNLTHRYAPLKAYFPQGKGKWGINGATGSESSWAASDNYYMGNELMKGHYGIARVESLGGMCCPHDPKNCLCYKNAKPPNNDPPSSPANCQCFQTHLKPNPDPTVKPIPCGPGVKDCDCFPAQCCPHPPTCPCQPGEHPKNDPNCECPETHPGTPCGPDVPDCDCFPDPNEVETELIIHEDEMTQALSAKMEAKGTKFVVVPMPAFKPASASGINNISSCSHYTTKRGRDKCRRDGSWDTHSFKSSMVYGPTTTQLQKVTSMNRPNLGLTTPQDQYKAMGLLTGEMTLKYGNTQLTDTYPGIMGITPGGPFDKENIFHFIGHRQGAGKSPVPIAAYMTATAKNLDYKKFIDERVNNWSGYPSIPGYQPMEGFKGLTDSGKGSYNFTVKYEAALANAVTGDPSEKVIINGAASPTIIIHQFFETISTARASPGSGCTRRKTNSWPSKYGCCSDIKSKADQYNGDFVLTGVLPRTDFKWDVRVDGTIVATAKANAALAQKETFGVAYNKDDFYKIQSPIPTWKFYPTFQMTWDATPAAPKENKEVWALAAGERTFNAYDALTIQHQSARIGMVAPWSRDFEDRDHDVNVTKAGTAYKAESGTNQILVDAYVTVIDPNFVHPDQRATVIADNQRRIEEYATAIETIVAASEDSWGMFTNLRAGSSKEAAYVVPFVASDKNQEELVKTQMKRTLRGPGHTNIAFEAFRTDGNVTGTDYTVPQAYSVRGWEYTKAKVGIPSGINTLTKAQTNLSELLYKAPGKAWYKEDYEGIIVVHLSALATLKNGMITEYASIYRHESDWQTAYNANSKPLANQYMGIYKIPKGKYGVGVDFKVPTFNVGGKGVAGLNVGSKIYEFGVRGNVFDDT